MNKFLKNGIMILASCLLLAACGGKTETVSSGKAKRDTKVVIAHDSDITGLTAMAQANMSTGRVEDLIYSRLFDYDKDKNIIPILAERYAYLDENTIEIPLKKGIKFHNGDEMTAEDIAFSFQFWRDALVKAHMIDSIDKVEIKDSHTVVIKTKYPYSPLMGNIVAGFGALNKKHITTNSDYAKNPVGTGPYKFVEWVPGDRVVVEAFDEYFEGKPEVKTIVLKPVSEGTSRTMGLEAGDYDIAIGIDEVDEKTIEDHKNLDLYSVDNTRVTYMIMNNKNPKLNNLDVRKAMAYAIDRESIIDAVLEGKGEKAEGLVPVNFFGYSKSLPEIPHNVELAKDLMKKAGYADGMDLTMIISDKSPYPRTAQIIQANLKDIGINMNIEILEWGTFLEYTAQGKHELTLLGWSSGSGDADYSLYPLLHSSTHGGGGNRSFYSNKEMDNLLVGARTNMDRIYRQKAYDKVQNLLQTDMPLFPLFFGKTNLAANKNISGIEMVEDGRHKMYKLKVN